MYKVFVNNKPLYLTSYKDSLQLSAKNILKLEFNSEKDIHAVFDLLSNSDAISEAVIFSENEPALWKKFCQQFKVIEAAGGVVFNEKKELLMIHRLKKWDLPKGKIEKGENPDEAALREVCEETGVCDIEIINELTVTYHTYLLKKQNVLKKTFWFVMKCKSFSGFKVQSEESITDARWMNKAGVANSVPNMYPSLTDVISLSGI
jgi:hypothetical protein